MATKEVGLIGELYHYLKHHKKWWFAPMIAVFLFFGLLLVLGEVAPIVSPFIYTLF